MRAVSRAVLAKHPLIAFALVVMRWGSWLVAGHPVGAGLFLAALLSPTPVNFLLPAAVFAAVVDGLCILLASGQGTPIGRQYWLWAQACRFRRRWPSTSSDVGIHVPQQFPMVLSTNFYSNPEGLRPILLAPRLSIVPRFTSLHTASFSIRPWGAQRFDELKSQVARIADVDDRIVEARLEGPPEVRSRWCLRIVFANGHYNRRRRGSDRRNRPLSQLNVAERHQRRRTVTKPESLLAVWNVDHHE